LDDRFSSKCNAFGDQRFGCALVENFSSLKIKKKCCRSRRMDTQTVLEFLAVSFMETTHRMGQHSVPAQEFPTLAASLQRT
jgi:hypothetical protein